jgi:hypothetical protein
LKKISWIFSGRRLKIFLKPDFTDATVLLLLSVRHSKNIATLHGPGPCIGF